MKKTLRSFINISCSLPCQNLKRTNAFMSNISQMFKFSPKFLMFSLCLREMIKESSEVTKVSLEIYLPIRFDFWSRIRLLSVIYLIKDKVKNFSIFVLREVFSVFIFQQNRFCLIECFLLQDLWIQREKKFLHILIFST